MANIASSLLSANRQPSQVCECADQEQVSYRKEKSVPPSPLGGRPKIMERAAGQDGFYAASAMMPSTITFRRFVSGQDTLTRTGQKRRIISVRQ